MNGIAIIEKTDTETKGFFIDQEAIEFARLNAYTKKRIAQAEAAKRKKEQALRKIAKAEAKRKAYNLNTIKHILIRCGIIGAVAWAGMAGMIHPIIAIPVGMFCICTACLRLGAWFGKNGN
jgi:hypothetical protein